MARFSYSNVEDLPCQVEAIPLPGSGQPERVVDGVARLGEPARAVFGHVEVVFQADAELAGHADHRFVAEAHARRQGRGVAAYQVGAFVDLHADAVPGTVRQTRELVVRAEAVGFQGAPGGGVHRFAGAPRRAASKAASCARFSASHRARWRGLGVPKT